MAEEFPKGKNEGGGGRRRGFSAAWKSRGPRNGPRAGAEGGRYFLRGTGGWNFFIHASWKIIMTWLTDQ